MPLATSGTDDLALDGNWVQSTHDPKDDTTTFSSATSISKPTKKRKRSKNDTKHEIKVSSLDLDVTARKKKKLKTKRAKANPQCGLQAESSAIDNSCEWSCSMLHAALAAHAKAHHLAPLEIKDVEPKENWFIPCLPTSAVSQMPWALNLPMIQDKPGLISIMQCVQQGKQLPAPHPGAVPVIILCTSTERCFSLMDEIGNKWGVKKPLVLAAHGGGRKQDQVARQSKMLDQGVSLAVGTPGRVRRLLDGGHINKGTLEVIVIDLARDQKQRNLLTLAETRHDLFNVLKQHCLSSIGRGLHLALTGSCSQEP